MSVARSVREAVRRLATRRGRSPRLSTRIHLSRRPAIEALEDRCLLSGVVNEFPVPTPNSDPFHITAGPDGNLWFGEHDANKIGRISTTGVVTGEFPIPTPDSHVNGITTGPDGNLWFTEAAFLANHIGRITPNGVFTAEYPIPTPASQSIPGRRLIRGCVF